MNTIKIILLLLIISGNFACKTNRSMGCPAYWDDGTNKQGLQGTPLEKDENGEVKPPVLPDKSPVKKDKNTGLVQKKKNKKLNKNYARKR